MSFGAVPLLEACDDRDLFGFELWPRQRELLEAVEFGPTHHVLAVGRRSGKTTLAALVCLHGCLFRPDLDALVRRGERRYSVAVATNLSQARLLVQAARSIVENSPLLAETVESYTEDAITFTNGTELRAFPCSSRGGRGWPISTLVMDEAAHFLTETDGYQTAERVWEALVPSTAQFGDAARVIVASTPYGTQGLFAKLHADAASLDDMVAHHATTAEVNPTIDPKFLKRAEKRDPESYKSEYLAEFVGAGDAFLNFERITVAERGELSPDAGTDWIVGLDPAFAQDPFGFAVVGRDIEDPKRLITARAGALHPKGEFTGPVDAVAAIAREYGTKYLATDQYCAEPVKERLEDHGLRLAKHSMGATIKTEIFSELRVRLYNGSLEIYQHADLLAELSRLRTKFTPGQAAVVNPRVGGSHGDMAQALALAVYEHRRGKHRRRTNDRALADAEWQSNRALTKSDGWRDNSGGYPGVADYPEPWEM